MMFVVCAPANRGSGAYGLPVLSLLQQTNRRLAVDGGPQACSEALPQAYNACVKTPAVQRAFLSVRVYLTFWGKSFWPNATSTLVWFPARRQRPHTTR